MHGLNLKVPHLTVLEQLVVHLQRLARWRRQAVQPWQQDGGTAGIASNACKSAAAGS